MIIFKNQLITVLQITK